MRKLSIFAFVVVSWLPASFAAFAFPPDWTEIPIATGPAHQFAPDVYGQSIVWIESGAGYTLYTYDVSTGMSIPLTEATVSSAEHPAIHGASVVWSDTRNGGQIYMYDLSTQDEQQIPSAPSTKWHPTIHGDRIVWVDDRDSWMGDIFIYELSTSTENKLTDNESQGIGQINSVEIYGDKIVFDSGGASSSAGNIFLYDLSDETLTELTTGGRWDIRPAIHGDRVVYFGSCDIYMYDLSTGEETRLAGNDGYVTCQGWPDIDGNNVVWPDNRNLIETSCSELEFSLDPLDCEEYAGCTFDWDAWICEGIYQKQQSDIYMFDLATNRETRLTADPGDQISPRIQGNKIVYEDQGDVYVPEPAAHLVVLAGAALLGLLKRRQKSKRRR